MNIEEAYKVLKLNSSSSKEEVLDRYYYLVEISLKRFKKISEDYLRTICEKNNEQKSNEDFLEKENQKYCDLVKFHTEETDEIDSAYSQIIYERKREIDKKL